MKITDSNLSANSFPESTGIRRSDNIQPHRAEFLNIEAKSNHQSHDKTSCGENVFRLQTSVDLQYVKDDTATPMLPYGEAVCALCEKTVSLALGISLEGLLAKTRCNAETALARQIAMYLCHTTFSLLLTEIGVHFGRDRTTVSYACALVEDKRDDPEFDLMLSQLEACQSQPKMGLDPGVKLARFWDVCVFDLV